MTTIKFPIDVEVCGVKIPKGEYVLKREWVGLTGDEFLKLAQTAERGNYLTALRRMEAKLKEKNGFKTKRQKPNPHIGCFSYPNCDLDPNGCVVRNRDNAEQRGHQD